MTAPIPGLIDPAVPRAVKRMKENAADRDEAMERVRDVRNGDIAKVWPGAFSERYPTSFVANYVDVVARDLASNLSPLPSLACSAGQMRTDADRRRAEKKNRIGQAYWRDSRLQTQMKYGSDQYLTYGFLPFWVEADFRSQKPVIHVLDPWGCYYELDRWLRTKRLARTYRQDINELAVQFPEYANRILRDERGREYESGTTEVVQYIDDTVVMMYLPERQNTVVAQYSHGLDFCPVHVAVRPGLAHKPRGQFDDVLFVQLAHAELAALTLEAGHKSVQAPLAVPDDVQDLPIGPDAILVTNSPEKVQRVQLNVPPAAFALGDQLTQELQKGAGYPDTRFGTAPAGGVTGRGVSALEGGFDSQIRLGQDVLGEALRAVTEMGMKIEVTLWPKKSKTVTGTLSGESYSLTYVPERDLGEDTRVEVSYGFASGLSPNAAIVTLLQLRGDGIIGRDTFRRQLPMDIDVDQQQRELDVQMMEDGVKQGVAAGLSEIGQMIASGQPQLAMQFLTAAVSIGQGRQNGEDILQLAAAAFAPPPQPAAPQGAPPPPGTPQGAPGAPGAPGDDGLPGVTPGGLPTGVAPGQASLGPGGRPSIMDLTANFSGSGSPALNAGIRRRVPTG